MEIIDSIPLVAVIFLLGYGFLKILTGLRSEGVHYILKGIDVAVLCFVAWFALTTADAFSSILVGKGVEASWNSLSNDGVVGNLATTGEKVRDWFVWESKVEGILALTIVFQPLASMVSAGTLPWRLLMSYSLFWIWGTYYVSMIMRYAWPPMLTIGATLLTVPHLRRIGAPLYALALVYGPALVLCANVAAAALNNPNLSGVPSPDLFSFDLDYFINILSKMESAAKAVFEAATKIMIIHIVAGGVSAGVSGALGGPGIRLRA